jgi:norsolorinic acid ketoreductase
MSTTYLITGATRGLGRATVEKYLQRDNVTVIGTVRDPSHSTAKSLSSIPKGSNSNLIIITLDSTDFNPSKLTKTLTEDHGIHTLDVVISNAGIFQASGPIAQAQLKDLTHHVDTNAYGTLALFQATVDLLEKSTNPKFVAIGSALGSIGGMELRASFPMAAYGASKALQHFFVRRIHLEHPKITTFVVEPGFVQTDMGNAGARSFGMEKALDEIDDTIAETVKLIDAAGREEHSGRFIPTGKSVLVEMEGKDFPW